MPGCFYLLTDLKNSSDPAKQQQNRKWSKTIKKDFPCRRGRTLEHRHRNHLLRACKASCQKR